MKILLIKFRHIGDVLLTTPLIANLKHHYPDAHIDFAINDFCSDILAENPHINRLFPYRRAYLQQLRNPLMRLAEELRYFSQFRGQSYDLVINLTEGDRGAYISLLSGAAKKLGFKPRKGLLSRWRIFSPIGNEHLPTHRVNKDLQFVSLLGHPIIEKRVAIHWSETAQRRIEHELTALANREFCLIHPVARWMFKCWDDGKFAQVIDHLQEQLQLPVIITASPDGMERRRIERILRLCRSQVLDLSGRLSLQELACLAKRARLFVGVDTAPMHIAAAVGTPVIALFGHSEPLYWGPWDNDLDQDYSNQAGIQHHGRHTLIQKYHGDLNQHNGEHISPAMMDISAEEVIEQIEAHLSL
jgi:heptosyltransferase-3